MAVTFGLNNVYALAQLVYYKDLSNTSVSKRYFSFDRLKVKLLAIIWNAIRIFVLVDSI